MSRRRRCRALGALAIAGLAGCGSAAPEWDVAAVPVVTTTTTITTSTVPRPPPAPTTTRPAPTTTTRPRAPVTDRLARVQGRQAVVVTAARYGATSAELTAFERVASGWKAVFGPWSAWVGHKGIAPPGDKREGDGRTPSGTYGIDFMFGVEPDPGVRFPYRVVTGPEIVWVEDPASPNYNRWVDSTKEDAGANPDSMYKPQYGYGAVIAYNTAARTPGLGSGIFFHLSRDRPSAGCITLPPDQLLALLRWLEPDASPVVVISAG